LQGLTNFVGIMVDEHEVIMKAPNLNSKVTNPNKS